MIARGFHQLQSNLLWHTSLCDRKKLGHHWDKVLQECGLVCQFWCLKSAPLSTKNQRIRIWHDCRTGTSHWDQVESAQLALYFGVDRIRHC